MGGAGGGIQTGGESAFGGGGAGATPGIGLFGGDGTINGGGGGGALGGAIFVQDGGTLTMNDPAFTGPFMVTGGLGSNGAREAGDAFGTLVFLQQDPSEPSAVTFNISNRPDDAVDR